MDIVSIVLEIVETAKYPLLFIVYLIEGPIAGFVSSMASATGNLNVWIVYILFVIAEIGADIFYFYLGKGMSESKIGKRLNGVDNNFLKELNRATKESFFKVLLILKVTGIVAVPGLIYMGNTRLVNEKKFWLYTSLICFVKDTIIMILGYYTGLELSRFMEIYNIYKIVGIILLAVSILYLISRAYKEEIKNFVIKMIKNKI